jgi:hypothetical protein
MICQIDAEHWITIIAAILGLIGSAVLFWFSFTLIPLMGYTSSELTRQVSEKNKRLKNWQRVGFGFLCVSFVIQIVGATLLPIHELHLAECIVQ